MIGNCGFHVPCFVLFYFGKNHCSHGVGLFLFCLFKTYTSNTQLTISFLGFVFFACFGVFLGLRDESRFLTFYIHTHWAARVAATGSLVSDRQCNFVCLLVCLLIRCITRRYLNIVQLNVCVCGVGCLPHYKEMIMFWFACVCLCVRVSERVHYCSIEGMALLSFSKKVTTTCTLGWAEVKCLCFGLSSSLLEYLRLVDCFACGGLTFYKCAARWWRCQSVLPAARG